MTRPIGRTVITSYSIHYTKLYETVEESYLQDPLETMIIREQAYSDSKDMKLVALQYIRQALDEGRASSEVRKALEYLALESSTTVVRAGGVGRVILPGEWRSTTTSGRSRRTRSRSARVSGSENGRGPL